MNERDQAPTKARITRRDFLNITSAAILSGPVLLSTDPEARASEVVPLEDPNAPLTLLQNETASASRQADQHRQRLLTGWSFRRGGLGGVWEAWRNITDNVAWQSVALPHCFNAFDAVDPDTPYYQGPGWYRAQIAIANPYTDGRTLLHFEGAGQKTDVYVGTNKAGAHVGGYDEFTVDITEPAVRALANPINKGRVPVAVMCDNSRDLEMIPSDQSDFSHYGGLYRYVNLVYVPAISLERVHIDSSLISPGKASVSIRVRFYNPGQLKGEVRLSARILDPKGKVVHEVSRNLPEAKGAQDLDTFRLDAPALWSPVTPSLYRCEVTLYSDGGEMQVVERFGLRNFEFMSHGPFKLNVARLLLRGTQRHEDHAGLGSAMTEDLIRTEMELIKAMGANFIRLAHYQQSSIVLDLCDELGLLVWEEIPWCRGGLGGELYKEQARNMLKSMIDQHRNHPSVILWGLGNENDWPGDFEEFDKEKIRAFMSELNNLAHTLDPSRKTVIRRCDFCKDVVDVYSPSIWAGWYRGRYTDYKKMSEGEMKKVEHFLHAEWGGDSHALRHSESVDQLLASYVAGESPNEKGLDYMLTGGQETASKNGDWSETYICNLFDWHLKEQETMDWLAGTAQWVFKDFSAPQRPENPLPRVNQKGVVERDMTLKEGYFVFQSYWAERAMVRIYGHSWPVRWGKPNESKLVKVYSNCPKVELFVNGSSARVRQRNSQNFPAAGLRWLVKFKDGENVIKAVGIKDGATVTDTASLNYQTKSWGTPSKLVLEEHEKDREKITVRAMLLDSDGVPCLDSRKVVRFGLTGDGRLLDNLGTSTGSRRLELYNGYALIKVQLKSGAAIVSVSSEGLETGFLKLKSAANNT